MAARPIVRAGAAHLSGSRKCYQGGEPINSGSPISPHFRICTQQDPKAMPFSAGTSGWGEGGREEPGVAMARSRVGAPPSALGSPGQRPSAQTAWAMRDRGGRWTKGGLGRAAEAEDRSPPAPSLGCTMGRPRVGAAGLSRFRGRQLGRGPRQHRLACPRAWPRHGTPDPGPRIHCAVCLPLSAQHKDSITPGRRRTGKPFTEPKGSSPLGLPPP